MIKHLSLTDHDMITFDSLQRKLQGQYITLARPQSVGNQQNSIVHYYLLLALTFTEVKDKHFLCFLFIFERDESYNYQEL